MSLLVIGDSHSVIWEGNDVLKRAPQSLFPDVRAHHLPAPLGYNLMDADGFGLGKWGSEANAIVEAAPAGSDPIDFIMLCFGEIDIRTQVVKRAHQAQTTLSAETEVIVARILSFSEWLYRKHRIPVLVWEPIATSSSRKDLWNANFPATGSEEERNYCTELFSKHARKRTTALRMRGVEVYSFGIYEFTADRYKTNINLLRDGCHLNWEGFQLALSALRTLCVEFDLSADRFYCSDNQATAFDTPEAASIEIVKVRRGCDGGEDVIPAFPCKTDVGASPWIEFDLGYSAFVRSAVIYLEFPSIAHNIELSVGNDRRNLTNFRQEYKIDENSISYVFDKGNSDGFRFMRISLSCPGSISIYKADIFEDRLFLS
ncbi:MAG: hypothetical protein P8Q48_24040 [Paracoccaceae bacterium]|nr:hypothetical protein [Paracoccaceae bacterium]